MIYIYKLRAKQYIINLLLAIILYDLLLDSEDIYMEKTSFNYCIDDPNVIDLVLTWVNGSDPVWFNRMVKTAEEINYQLNKDFTEHRFIQHDEMKWALRSVEHFAPWINKIHIVTDNQYPSWIVKNHPKIQWVNHDTLFHYGYHSYSSGPIQFAFINIPNISKRFIYMDDDFIFLNHVEKSDFFDKKGRTKSAVDYTTFEVPHCVSTDGTYQYHYARLVSFNATKKLLNLTQPIYDAHVPIPMDMSVLFQLESQIDVTGTIDGMFRQCEMYQFESLYIQYAYGTNRLVPMNNSEYLALFHKEDLVKLYNATQLPKLVCVNFYDEEYFNKFLPSLFPQKSSFEL